MRRDQALYFFDFVLCPILIAYYSLDAIASGGGGQSLNAIFWCFCGLVLWTFIEYWVHRGLFHHAPGLREMHEVHHRLPELLIGAPPAILPCTLVLLGYILFSTLGPLIHSSICAGLLTGYLVYSFVHYATHHIEHARVEYLVTARRKHLQHHYSSGRHNFGVTTDFWDHVFGTAFIAMIRLKRRRAGDFGSLDGS